MIHSLLTSQLQILTKLTSTRVPSYGNKVENGILQLIRLVIVQVIGKVGQEKKFAIVIIQVNSH